jgi:prevent-host-death family protein
VKIESITEVKKRFTQIVRELPETGMVVVTRDGRPAAVVMEVGEDTDLEALALSTSRRFWDLWDRANRGKTVALTDIPVRRDEALARSRLAKAERIAERSTEYRPKSGKKGSRASHRTRRSR